MKPKFQNTTSHSKLKEIKMVLYDCVQCLRRSIDPILVAISQNTNDYEDNYQQLYLSLKAFDKQGFDNIVFGIKLGKDDNTKESIDTLHTLFNHSYEQWGRIIRPVLQDMVFSNENIVCEDDGKNIVLDYMKNLYLDELVSFVDMIHSDQMEEPFVVFVPENFDVLVFFQAEDTDINSTNDKRTEINIYSREEWDQHNAIPLQEVMPQEVLQDVPITITFQLYKQRIKKLKLTKATKSTIADSCCICLGDFKNGTTVHQTPCNHTFHASCLRKQCIKIGPPKCPLCRHDVRENIAAV